MEVYRFPALAFILKPWVILAAIIISITSALVGTLHSLWLAAIFIYLLYMSRLGGQGADTLGLPSPGLERADARLLPVPVEKTVSMLV